MIYERHIFALAVSIFGVPYQAHAEYEEDIPRALSLECSYSDYKTFQHETASIEILSGSTGGLASIKTFRRGEKLEQVKFLVRPGKAAECVFPSGNRIRTKVGEGTSHPYGMCGGDPEVFASVWVNQRKVASRVWFAGHCREEKNSPDVSFKFSGGHTISIQKCHSARQSAPESTGNDAEPITNEPLSVCVELPDISRYSRDFLEYPPQDAKVLAVGDIELLEGTHKVCDAIRQELRVNPFTFHHYNSHLTKLRRPGCGTPSVELPEELVRSGECIFDFDNDGKLDRIFVRSFETTYMDGSVLLVQPGSSVSKLNVPDTLMDKASNFLPCQMGSVRYEIRDCPPFSQKGDDAGFSMKGRPDKAPVYFRARYSSVSPFTFQGINFIGVNSNSEDTKEFVDVITPLPNRRFQPMCLLRRVTENF